MVSPFVAQILGICLTIFLGFGAPDPVISFLLSIDVARLVFFVAIVSGALRLARSYVLVAVLQPYIEVTLYCFCPI